DCQKLQLDQRSMPWREVRDVVLDAARKNAGLKVEFELLSAWDGMVGSASQAAAIFELFLAEMIVRVTFAKAPKGGKWLLGKAACRPGINLFYLRRVGHLCRLLNEQPAGWFAAGWAVEIVNALTTIKSKYAENGWPEWGACHPLRLQHAVLGEVWPFAAVF